MNSNWRSLSEIDGLLDLERELLEIETESQEFKGTKGTDQNADRIQAGVDGADTAVKEIQRVQQANGKLIQLVTEELY